MVRAPVLLCTHPGWAWVYAAYSAMHCILDIQVYTLHRDHHGPVLAINRREWSLIAGGIKLPIQLNAFRCSNGHSFEANAKLRTRCPECGVMTKRSFTAAIPTPDPKPDPIVDKPPETSEPPKIVPSLEPKKRPVLVRQGRARSMPSKTPAKKKEAPLPPKKTLIGSKVSAGLVKSKTLRTRGVIPTIKGRPIKTAVVRGGVQGREQKEIYWHSVARKFGF